MLFCKELPVIQMQDSLTETTDILFFLTHRAPFILAQCLHDDKLLGMDFPLFER